MPLQDIEEYAKHLVANTRWDLSGMSHVTAHQDHNMKLATRNMEPTKGAKEKISLQRGAIGLCIKSHV